MNHRICYAVKAIAPVIFLFAAGVGAGILNGFLGTGGGVIIVFLLRRYYTKEGDADATRTTFSAAVITILALSAVSAFFYQKNGNLPLKLLPAYLPSALIGGTVGAFLLGRLKTAWLNRLFGIVLLVAGICMVLKSTGVMR